jgi:hypothetical protein
MKNLTGKINIVITYWHKPGNKTDNSAHDIHQNSRITRDTRHLLS